MHWLDRLCLLCRDFPPSMDDWDDEDEVVGDLVLLGIVGIQDPVRPEVSAREVHPEVKAWE